MSANDRLHTPEVEAELAKAERARRVVAKAKANKKFMDGVRAGLESQLRGEGVRFEEVRGANRTKDG